MTYTVRLFGMLDHVDHLFVLQETGEPSGWHVGKEFLIALDHLRRAVSPEHILGAREQLAQEIFLIADLYLHLAVTDLRMTTLRFTTGALVEHVRGLGGHIELNEGIHGLASVTLHDDVHSEVRRTRWLAQDLDVARDESCDLGARSGVRNVFDSEDAGIARRRDAAWLDEREVLEYLLHGGHEAGVDVLTERWVLDIDVDERNGIPVDVGILAGAGVRMADTLLSDDRGRAGGATWRLIVRGGKVPLVGVGAAPLAVSLRRKALNSVCGTGANEICEMSGRRSQGNSTLARVHRLASIGLSVDTVLRMLLERRVQRLWLEWRRLGVRLESRGILYATGRESSESRWWAVRRGRLRIRGCQVRAGHAVTIAVEPHATVERPP